MKKIVWTFGLAAAFGIIACNDAGRTDSVKQAEDSNAAKAKSDSMPMPVDKASADFAVEAAHGGMMEVALGKLAQEKGMNNRVKDFGAMMITDHTAADDKLKMIASSKNITLPDGLSEGAKKSLEDLQKKTGRDFDKAYIGMMESDHKKDVDAFMKASQNLTDPELKTFATETLPVLQKHLDSVTAINNSLKGKK